MEDEMEWKSHYTGIEIANPRGNGSGLYMSRDTKTKRIKFIRYSCRRRRICIFKGYMNMLKMRDHNYGLEIDFGPVRFGIAIPPAQTPLYRILNPRIAPPMRRWFAKERDRNRVAVRLGWFCFGMNLPKVIANYMIRKDHERWSREMANYEENEHDQPDPCHPNDV
jgi:hypothetical protein